MSLTSADYKKIAKSALKGHWGTVIFCWLFALIFGAFFFSIPFISVHIIFVVASMVIFEPVPHYFLLMVILESILLLLYYFIGSTMELGYIDLNLSLLDRRKVSSLKLVSHFPKMVKAVWYRIIITCLKLVGTVLFLLPGVLVSLTYAMTPYILEEKEYSILQAMQASRMIMKGHKGELFALRMSFFGWYLFGILTLGLGFFYVHPYIRCAEAVFFNEISGRADVYYGRIQPDITNETE